MVNSKFPIFLFIGTDTHSKEMAIEELGRSFLDRSGRELNYKVFYGGEVSVRDVLDYVSTVPFISSKRLAVIRDFEKLSQGDKARLVSYIKKPSKSAFLVLESENDSVLREYSDISRYANIRRFGELSDLELESWVKGHLSKKGKSIEVSALAALKELAGEKTSDLFQELEKLITFTGERSRISLADVEEAVGRSLMASAFDITAAIDKKNIDVALEVVSDLAVAGKKPHEVIGILNWYLKRLLRAKTLAAQGETNSGIARILGIGRKYTSDFFKQVKMLDIEKIKSKMEILLEADLDIKRTRFDPRLILEFTVIRLCLGLR